MPKLFATLSISTVIILLVLVVPVSSSIDRSAQLFLQRESPTATQTNTATQTPTQTITGTVTLTTTPVISGTLTPSPINPVEFTPTLELIAPTEPTAIPITVTATMSPTATLIPFPSVTMVFPTGGPEATVTPAATPQADDRSGAGRVLIITGLLVFWSALIAWFWYIQKRT
jgi:hypothetical protein